MIHSRRSRGAGGRGRASPRFGAENTFTDVFDNTRDISDFKKQDRLNNYLLVYCHKSITDTLDTVKIACANEQHNGILKNLRRGVRMSEWKMSPSPRLIPPLPPTVQNAPPPLGLFALLLKKVILCIAY